MEVELTINLIPSEDGTAVLTVEGPTDGVWAAYQLMMHMLEGMLDMTVTDPGEVGDSTVG